ncbi:hypothetical protein D3C84_1089660 [compost metagenome]
MSFEIAAVDTIENPYKTFSAYQEGCSKEFIAKCYFDDLVEICDFPQKLSFAEVQRLRSRYLMLVECAFDGGDVELVELRGWVDGVACFYGTDSGNFEWLHDAFEWVLK